MDADAGRLGRRRLSEGEEARVEPGSLRGLRVVATPAPVTPEDLAVLQTDVLVGYVFAQAAAGSARPGRRRAARETRVRIRRSRRPRLDPLADRHPPIVPAAFRKLDAVACSRLDCYPAPLGAVPGRRTRRIAAAAAVSPATTTE
jgi:hypothetical protein